MQLAGICSLFKTVPVSFLLLTLSFSLLLLPIGCGGGAPGKTPRLFEEPAPPPQPNTAQVTVDITSPGEGTSVAASSVRVVAHASGANPISSMSVLVDGSRVLHVAGGTIDARIAVAVGSHSTTVQATDSKGNPAEKAVRFAVTAAHIDISIAAPLPNSITLAPSKVVVKASGANRIASLQLLIDEREERKFLAASLDTSISASLGRHSLRIRATDSEGNSAEKSLQFVISEPRFAVVSLMGTTDPEDGYFPFSGTVNSYPLDSGTGALSTSPISTIWSGASFSQPFVLLKDEEAGLLFDLDSQDRNGPGGFGVLSIDQRSGVIGWPARDGAEISSPSLDNSVLAANGELLYVAGVACPIAVCNWADAMGIGAWKVDRSNGTLTPVLGMPLGITELPRGPTSLSYDPGRKLLFASQAVFTYPDWTVNILTYQIDETSGTLALKGNKHWELRPQLGPVHPSGKFLYGFTANETVALELGNSGPVRVSSRSAATPDRLYIEPSGRFAVGILPARQIALYGIDQSTGALSRAVPPIALPGNPHTVALDASGELVYVTNELNVSVFRLDRLQGKLAEIEGSPFRIGTDQQPQGSAIVIMSATTPATDY